MYNWPPFMKVVYYILELTFIVLLFKLIIDFFSFQSKARMYPWKTVRIQDLPEINNNGEFNIPFSPAGVTGTDSCYGSIFPPSSAVEQLSAHYERPNLRRTPIHSKVSDYTGELSGSLNVTDWGRFVNSLLLFLLPPPHPRFCWLDSVDCWMCFIG